MLRRLYGLRCFLPVERRDVWTRLLDECFDAVDWWERQPKCPSCGMPEGWCTALCGCPGCGGPRRFVQLRLL
jgi:hypothetical protein